MLGRLVSVVLAALGMIVALLVGLWVLLFVGLVALAAAVVHRLRGLRAHAEGAQGRVVEGEFKVVDDNVEERRPNVTHDND